MLHNVHGETACISLTQAKSPSAVNKHMVITQSEPSICLVVYVPGGKPATPVPVYAWEASSRQLLDDKAISPWNSPGCGAKKGGPTPVM